MQKKSTSLIVMLLVFTIGAAAQTTRAEVSSDDKEEKKSFNFIKVNLTALALKNYSVQYEHTLSRKWSFALAVRSMPNTGIPFKKSIIDAVGADDPETVKTIEAMKLSNFAITPEFRFYVSKKGYGRGFYIAPFYRYAKFKTKDVRFTYQDNNNTSNDIYLSGDVSAHTGGILFGVQSMLGKRICLDLWLLGPHYGSGKGTFSGISSKQMTASEQADLRQELEDFEIPLTDKTVSVNSTGATVKLDGPWGGIRSGISIGIRF